MTVQPETAEHANQTAAVAPVRSPSRLRRWLRRLVVVGLLFGCLYFFRGPILRQIGGFLVVSEPPEGNTLLVFDERGTLYDEAGRLYNAGSFPRVLFFRLQPRRSQQIGVVLSGDLTSRRELDRRGVPEKAMTVLPAEGRRSWDKAAALRDWLNGNPEAKVVLLCNRFESRRIRCVLDRSLGADAHRVHLQAIPDPRYDETNWWRRKEGAIDLFNNYVRVAYIWVNGNGGEVQPDLAPDEYGQTVGAAP